MIIIYSSFIVITEKQNLDSCITIFFFNKPYIVTCLFIYSIDNDNIEQVFFELFFVNATNPIQFLCCLQIYLCMCLSNTLSHK